MRIMTVVGVVLFGFGCYTCGQSVERLWHPDRGIYDMLVTDGSPRSFRLVRWDSDTTRAASLKPSESRVYRWVHARTGERYAGSFSIGSARIPQFWIPDLP